MMLNGRDIRTLRQRLGWSVAEMARRMGCGSELIQKWEAESSQPDPEAMNQLHSLSQHVESYSEQMALKPQVEKAMEERRMAQLTNRDLLKDLQ